jgi:predicted RNase H-like nuclease
MRPSVGQRSEESARIRVMGVDACKKGWVGVTGDLRACFGTTIEELVDLAELDGALAVVGVDIPIGLPVTGPRQADVLARRAVGSGRRRFSRRQSGRR